MYYVCPNSIYYETESHIESVYTVDEIEKYNSFKATVHCSNAGQKSCMRALVY